MCLAKGQNAVTPVRLKPAALLVKHSSTEPLLSPGDVVLRNFFSRALAALLFDRAEQFMQFW